MEQFKIEIAGLVAQIAPLFESTKAYCQKYLSNHEADCFISVTEADLRFEQEMLDIEAREEGMKLRKFTPPFLERAAIQRKIAEALLQSDTLLLHGSTVAVDGKAYLFTAACGTGKSTHTRFWREVFGDRAVMINDDKTFLKFTEEGIIAYGSPWSGKHGLDTRISAPLKGICILHRGKENVIQRICAEKALPMLHHQSYVSADECSCQKVFALAERLSRSVPIWSMECTKEQAAATVAFGAMSAEDCENRNE